MRLAQGQRTTREQRAHYLRENNMITTQRTFTSRLRAATLRFLREREGASFIEYIIVVGLVAIIAITAFTDFGDKVVGKLREETTALDKIQVK
jgi:Flp pilus assembly pilin Flp